MKEELSMETSPKTERKHMSNPKNFCEELTKLNIRYEHLVEARASINCTNLARMFIGKSSRGGVAADIVETWIRTFEYVLQHPDEDDHDQYTARRIEPKKEYYDYIELISKPISEEVRESWKKLSNPKLGKEAPKYGYTIGITNGKAIKTLHARMEEMFERRNNNIWNKKYEEVVPKKDIDYRMMNVPDLRAQCKERSLPNAHLKQKNSIIKLLERNPLNSVYTEVSDETVNYDKMVVKKLKALAKERGIVKYNNLKKDELIELHQEYDKEKLIQESEEEAEINNETTEENINKTIEVFNFNGSVIRTFGTYEEPLFLVKDVAEILELKNYWNVYSKMDDYMKKDGLQLLEDTLGRMQKMEAINEAGLYYMIIKSTKPIAKDFQKLVFNEILPTIRKKGEYKLDNKRKMLLQRPMRQLLTLSEIDIEAEELEMKFDMSLYSNKTVIYLAYIGKNLVKVGFSDKRLCKREEKHTSCESQFEQFRIIKAFEVSGQPIEKIIKDLLHVYNVKFHFQCEIYKPPGSLENFIEIVTNMLNEHDLKFQLDNLRARYKELEIENLNLRLRLNGECTEGC